MAVREKRDSGSTRVPRALSGVAPGGALPKLLDAFPVAKPSGLFTVSRNKHDRTI
jgi:hypothetical protein